MSSVEAQLVFDERKYIHSSTALFNFMNRYEYLCQALRYKKLTPRYCEEDMSYLGVTGIEHIYVLQKCFCDIPLHELTMKFHIDVDGDSEKINPDINKVIDDCRTHPGLYGKYGIAFSKEWAIDNNIQPVMYINDKSFYAKHFRETIQYLRAQNDVDDILVDELLQKMAYIKPIEGKMKRKFGVHSIEFKKNFHDEREWRFVPQDEILEEKKIPPVCFARPSFSILYGEINRELEKEDFLKVALNFDYEDVRYLIVPDNNQRKMMIEYILGLPEDNFKSVDINDKYKEKCALISKILVLDEIKEDW